MRILFKKDYPDPRKNRRKVFKKGKTIMCAREFGQVAVKEGFAVEVEPVNILEEIKKNENLKKLKKDDN